MNRVKTLLSYRLSHWGVVADWRFSPLFISVEPINGCNLRCPECPVGMRIGKQNMTRLDTQKYQSVVDELSLTLGHIIFYFQGEPLLNRDFSSFVEYAVKYGIFTSTSTNAQLIDAKNAEKIVRSGLDKIIISIDGTTQEVYEAYRRGGELQKAIAGVEHLIACRERLKVKHPFVEIQFLVLRTNQHQIAEIKKLTKRLKADKLTLKTAQLYDFENGNSLLTTIDKYARYRKMANGTYRIKSSLPNHCWRLWSGAVIDANQRLVPCCFDKDSKYHYGSLRNQDFLTIYNSEKATQLRKAVITNRKAIDMCKNCTSR